MSEYNKIYIKMILFLHNEVQLTHRQDKTPNNEFERRNSVGERSNLSVQFTKERGVLSVCFDVVISSRLTLVYYVKVVAAAEREHSV